MISLNVKQWRSEDQTKLDQFVPDPCACTCHRTDVEDEKYQAICCQKCGYEFDGQSICDIYYHECKEKESRQRKRKVLPN